MLNNYLYSSLKQRFGIVKVCNQNIKAQKVSSARKAKSIKGGEYYAVCCPVCNDKRYRLWISYLWGTSGEDGKSLDYLCHCFNESCEQRSLDLRNELQSYIARVRKGRKIINEDNAQVEKKLLASPGECIFLHDLKRTHPACIFFEKRGFDPYELSKQYSLSVCINPDQKLAPSLQLFLWNRIIIPVFYNDKIVGWQARYCGVDGNGTPPDKKIAKYWTASGFPKSKYLYNYDATRKMDLDFGIVVEGVTDVFRLPISLACFGHDVSIDQRDLLWRLYKNKALVLLLDPDVSKDKTDELKRILAPNYKNGVANVILPDNKDPADFSFDELINEIYNQSLKQGIKL